MRKFKTGLCLWLVCLCILVLCPFGARAEGPIAVDTPCSLTVNALYTDGTKIPGMDFDIYFIASTDAYTNFTPTEKFAPYTGTLLEDGLDLDGWNELASLLADAAAADGIEPDRTAVTDDGGSFTLDGLAVGLYLAVGKKAVVDPYTYTVKPAIISLPSRNPDTAQNNWLYDLSVTPKPDREENPEDPVLLKREVLKIWDDKGAEDKRPSSVEIRLLKDGTVYDTVKLDASNDWRKVWEDLPECDENGAVIEWTVAEVPADGYSVTVKQTGITFAVTNTRKNNTPSPEGPDDPKLPQTGVLWWPVPVLAAVGIVLLAAGFALRKKRAV